VLRAAGGVFSAYEKKLLSLSLTKSRHTIINEMLVYCEYSSALYRNQFLSAEVLLLTINHLIVATTSAYPSPFRRINRTRLGRVTGDERHYFPSVRITTLNTIYLCWKYKDERWGEYY
jgi:hypothetical protein